MSEWLYDNRLCLLVSDGNKAIGFPLKNWKKLGVYADRPSGCYIKLPLPGQPFRRARFSFNDHPLGGSGEKYAVFCIKGMPAMKCNSQPERCPRTPLVVPTSFSGSTTHYPTINKGPESSCKKCAPLFYSGFNRSLPHFDDVCYDWHGPLSEARSRCDFTAKCTGLFDYGANHIRRDDNGLGANAWRYCRAMPRGGNREEAWIARPGTCSKQHFNPQEHGLAALATKQSKKAMKNRGKEEEEEEA